MECGGGGGTATPWTQTWPLKLNARKSPVVGTIPRARVGYRLRLLQAPLVCATTAAALMFCSTHECVFGPHVSPWAAFTTEAAVCRRDGVSLVLATLRPRRAEKLAVESRRQKLLCADCRLVARTDCARTLAASQSPCTDCRACLSCQITCCRSFLTGDLARQAVRMISISLI